MKTMIKLLISFCLITGLISFQNVFGQSAIGQLETMTKTKIVSPSIGGSVGSMNSMIGGALLQGLFSSMLKSNSANAAKAAEAKKQAEELAAKQAAEQAARIAEQQRQIEAKAQADHDQMMGAFKQLEGAQSLNQQSLAAPDLDFKNLNGEAENMSSDARKQFEASGNSPVIASSVPLPIVAPMAPGTPFFGDKMPVEDLKTLTEPENNPNVVDLRASKKFVDSKINYDTPIILAFLRTLEADANGSPIVLKPDCDKLNRQLKGYLNQRIQFQKTIDLSHRELEAWETANHDALINAATDGLEYFAGKYAGMLADRVKAADRLQRMYDNKLLQMTFDEVNTLDLQTKIDNLRQLSSAGQIAGFITNLNDWQTFMKDGLSSMLAKLAASNDEVKQIWEDPKTKDYFQTEAPELNTLLDISKIAASSEVFGKWAAKKMPLISTIEISIKQTYNAFDWILSFNRMTEARQINGGVMETAKYIQKKIDDTYAQLKGCP